MADEGATPVAEQPPAEPINEAPPPASAEADAGGHEGAQMKVQEKRSCGEKFQKFLYDSDTGKVLGRSGMSWLKIFVFYIIFYIAIFAFFFMLLIIVFQFTNETRPRLIGTDSLLKGSPGLGFRPTNPYKSVNAQSALIWYNRNDSKEYKMYTEQLKKITGQESKKFKYTDCNITTNPKELENKMICKAYSKIHDWGNCTAEREFGYPTGQPCVLIRLNRIIGWSPESVGGKKYKETKAYKEFMKMGMDKEELPKQIMSDMAEKYIWISCSGDKPLDKALIGDLLFYPRTKGVNIRPAMTIPNIFFPYMSQKGYLDPFIMVQFLNPTPGTLIQVRCQAYNENIKVEPKDGLGSVRFELMVDSF